MKPTLLVLAAGMGSRFGGLKQMEPVGPSGEWILDYSVSDAVKAGFGKVVFVIRREMEKDFRELTESKYRSLLDVAYAFQDIDDLPIALPSTAHRQKPWGTGHAVYAARAELHTPFAVINADDFYGRNAFEVLAKFLSAPQPESSTETYGLVGYRLSNTLSAHGSVSRGVCTTAADGSLLSIEEHSEIQKRATDEILAKNASGETVTLSPETTVSLNCWAFPAGWVAKLIPLLQTFLEAHGQEPKSEFYLPAAVDTLVKSGVASCQALPCSARWLGVTHREDLPAVKDAIQTLVTQGEYPIKLFA